MKQKKDKNNYSEEYIKKHRTFPTCNTVILTILVIIQIVLVFIACTVEFNPQDLIKKYTVTVEPKENGTLDITYEFVWQALDTAEELTWIEIGMANENYTVYDNSLSTNIERYEHYAEEDYTSLDIYFKRSYKGGETLKFSFKINQRNMLCRGTDDYFYEFVPGWFNSTPIESFEFKWKKSEQCVSAVNSEVSKDYYVWSGSLECGEYRKLDVHYHNDAFTGANTVQYESFDSSGAFNDLKETKIAVIVMLIIVILILLAIEIFIADSYVSYARGRGFISGYGHCVHTYGRINPKYTRARNHHIGTSSRGVGGGCACACACACAGGGRAGCNQKDTYTNK